MNSKSLDPIEAILGQDGLLAKSLTNFEFRPSQVELARMIERAILEKIPAIAEAGTGTGKTMGYLAPVVLSGKKTIISTGTKNLQDQVFFKDVPLLSKAIGEEIDAMLMKGRKNYLCLHRYNQFFSQPSMLQPDHVQAGKKIEKWLRHTTFADRGELSWLRDDDPLWDFLSSNSDQCIGTECLHWEECYLNLLRQRAAQARIIIVNHHLFFADLMVKKGGFGEILPRAQVVVFDEAHTIEEIATTYFGMTLSTHQLTEFVSDVEKETAGFREQEKKKIKEKMDHIRAGAIHLQSLFTDTEEKGRLSEAALQSIQDHASPEINAGLGYFRKGFGSAETRNASLEVLVNRASDLEQRLSDILSSSGEEWLRWFERRKRNLTLHASPLDISESMKELLYSKVKALAFTSATLSTGGDFSYFSSRMGLATEALHRIYPSHFDFEKNTLLYVPKDLPIPNDPAFQSAAAQRMMELLHISAGRALVLFTSHHNLNMVYQLLKGQLPFSLFRQGDAPKSVLLDKFRADVHSVLLATGSFWQGVDVPGEALSCIIIDKLPFDSPGDPLVAARIDRIRSRGGNPFMDYQLPSAIISLKQGLGRLIRNSADRGVLSVLDVRMRTSRYGRFFFESLPRMPLVHDLQALRRFFEPL
jgi:ATP-dependent DNA helicase DinG